MVFTIRLRNQDGWLEFSQPRFVLRADGREQAYEALDEADRARRDGAWIAGLIPYELDGLALGVFDAPVMRTSFESRPYAASPLLPTVSMNEYSEAIAAIRHAIYDGEVYQVNYTVPFAIGLEGDAFSFFAAVARNTGAAFQAYVEDGDCRVLSWSPELFLDFNGSRVMTRPMKGTSPPDDTTPLTGEKNRAEHIMIVDLLRNDLQRVCDDVDVTALCTIERYPTYATMTSTIEGTLHPSASLAEIFRAAFPCGSITGAPKRAAMTYIATLEHRRRGAYCGAVGFLSPDRKGWWNVAIRTAQFKGASGRFDVGGGIVSDSDCSDEWNEILIKSAFLREAAGSDDFELLETFAADAPDHVLAMHGDRLCRSAAVLDIPVDAGELRSRIDEERNPHTLVRLRLARDGSLRFVHEELARASDAVPVCLSDARVQSSDPWLGIKSSWRPAHRRAWSEAQSRGCFDAILINERDELTEGSRTNLFVEIDGLLYTPPLLSGLLPGVLRSCILAEGRAEERVLLAGDLHRASALFVGNSARGLIRARLQS
jgi:para-aminobenzoate synthetase/4-amino-4-deoxychorismate lyase